MNSLNKLLMPCSSVSQTRNWQYTASSFFSIFLVGLFILMNGSAEMYGQSQSFTTPGTTTFTVPAGVTNVTVEVWGGGGAGGGVDATNLITGGGGGGGTYTKATGVAVTPGGTITLTVGAGGAASLGLDGGAGEPSTFGSTVPVTAIGGNGGFANIGGAHGAGAAAALGITFNGGAGGVGNTNLAAIGGGGGGGGAGAGGAGAAPTGGINSGLGGIAGSGIAGGNGASGIGFFGDPGADGVNATGLAAGGSGARNDASGIVRIGGNGGSGRIIVSWGPVLTLTGTTAHGSSCVGTAATSITNYTITNTSASAATGIVVTSSDPQFVVSALSSTIIAAGGTATFTVTFTPTSAGAKSSNITVSGTPALGNTPVLGVTGTGVALPTAPVVGAITDPTCPVQTGSVALSGLPSGVGTWTVTAMPGGATITGSTATATFSGLSPATTYTFTVSLSGCVSPASANAVIGANPLNTISLTSATGTSAQTACINTVITNITYATTGATGATFSGLPVGVTGSWAANVVTISGTPLVAGPYTYTVTLTGGCGAVTATGTIGVTPDNTVTLTSAGGTNAQTPCINTAITNITYGTTGATGATFSGLPAGVTGSWAANVVTISGTPTVAGNFSYTVTLTGGCGTITATGTINVAAATTISYASPTFCVVAGGSATVNRVGIAGGTYSSSSPNLVVNPTTGAIDLAMSLVGGPYTVSYSFVGGTCPSPATTTVSINAAGVSVLTPVPASTCVNSPITISSSLPPTTGTYVHSWVISGAVTASTTGGPSPLPTSTATFTPTAPGTVTVTYNVTDGNGCVSAPVSVPVTVLAPPVLVAGMAGTNQFKCENGSFTLAATLTGQPAGAVGTWTVEPANASVVFSDINSPTATVTGVPQSSTGVGTTLRWTVTNGSCAPQSATVVLTNQLLRLNSTLTPAAVCSGSTFTYPATSGTPSAVLTWTRAAVAGISNAAVTTPVTGNVSEMLINTTSAAIPVTYLYTTTANGCSGVATDAVVVMVNPKPTLSSSLTPPATCSGSVFSYTPTSATTTPTVTFKWTRAAVVGISNTAVNTAVTGNINETLVNTTSGDITVTYVYTLTLPSSTCPNTQNVTVVVKPSPSLSSALTIPAVCSGSPATYTPTSATSGATFTVSRAVVAGISNAALTATAVPAVPGSFSETLINTTSSDVTVTYVYTTTANSCSTPQNVTVVVKPTTGLSSAATATDICSGTAVTYTPTSTGASPIFTWTRAAVPGINQPATSGAGAINEILTSTNTDVTTVRYYYRTTVNGCISPLPGNPVDVVVKPTPTLSSPLAATVCSPVAPFNYSAVSSLTGSSAGITTFSWSRAAVAGAGLAAASGPNASASISENLTLASQVAPVTINYVFTMTAASCVNTQTVVVTLSPTPVLSNATKVIPTICSGSTAAYTPTSVTTGSVFTWTRVNIAGITPLQAAAIVGPPAIPAVGSGTGNISEVLTNTTPNDITVTYNVTTTANGCSSTEAVTVVVKPIPVLSNVSKVIPAICSGTAATYTPATATAGTPTFSWTRAAVGGNAATSGVGNPSEVLTNTGLVPFTATYLYTTSVNSCSNASAPEAVTVVVNPVVGLTSAATAGAICSGTMMTPYTATSNIVGATFAWSRAAQPLAISEGATSGTGTTIGETLTNLTNAAVTVPFVYVISANGCSNSHTVNVTVNPKATISPMTAIACSGITFASLPQNGLTPLNGIVPANTTYSWLSPSVTGGLTGGTGGTNQNLISGTLTNPSTSAGTATYTVTPTSGGCVGASFQLVVTVNPKPTLSSVATTATCSGSAFNFTAASGTSGVAFAWSRTNISGITPAPVTTPVVIGSGIGDVSEILTNTTILPINVTYVYTMTANSCSNTQNVVVTINPTPSVDDYVAPAICSGGQVSYAPVNVTNGIIPTGTTYTWPGSGGAQTSFTTGTLTNLTGAPTTSQYVITPLSGTCSGNTFTVDVTVNPTPTITGTLSVCVGSTTTLTGSSAGTWSSGSTGVATVNATTGVVTGVSAGTATITFMDGTGCSKTANVIVNARPTATISATAPFISQGCNAPISVSISPAIGSYSPNLWTVDRNDLLTFTGPGLSTTMSAPTSTPVTVPTTVVVNFETRDANNCLAEAAPITLTIYPELDADLDVNLPLLGVPVPLCVGTSKTLNSGATGGFATGRTITYASSNTAIATVNATTGEVTGVSNGTATITVTVTDASGCMATDTRDVAVSSALALTAVPSNVGCKGGNTGVICLTPHVPTQTYSWSNSATAFCNAGLVAGTYSVTISDASTGCSQTISSIVITEPATDVSATISGTTGVCAGATAPEVTFTGVGGTAPYTFNYTINDGTTTTPGSVTTVSGSSVTVAQPTTIGSYVYTLVSVSSVSCTQPVTGQTATISVGAAITGNTAGPDQPAITTSTTTLQGELGTGTSGLWTVVPANPSITFADATSPTTTVSGIVGTVTLRWAVSNVGGCTVYDNVLITRTAIKMDIIAALEGPLNATTGEMITTGPFRTALNLTLPNPLLPSSGLSAIVDWVTVELRTTANVAATGDYKRDGLIRTDGRIVEAADGTSPLSFNIPDGNYFVVVKHRNHLGFRSASAKTLSSSVLTPTIDFATNLEPVFGNSPLKVINGVYCAYSGNSDILNLFIGNQQVNAADNTVWQLSRFQSGYKPADYNFDGVVNSIDYAQWQLNRFKTEQF